MFATLLSSTDTIVGFLDIKKIILLVDCSFGWRDSVVTMLTCTNENLVEHKYLGNLGYGR